MTKTEEKKFGLLRSVLWPVHRHEFKKVVSMLLLLFFLCSCYNVLRNLKDTVILTAKHSGAEVIPFLKVWGMLPGVFIATWIYTRLTRYFSRENVFYIMVTGFLAYFLLFAFVLYPNSQQFHLNALGDWLTAHLPKGFSGMIAMIRNWSFTTFYVIAELWAVIVLTVLYWGFTNEVTAVSQAKRTYGILNIGSNVAPIIGGFLGILFSQTITLPFLQATADPWEHTIKQLMLLVSVLGTSAMVCFYWINRKVVAAEAAELNKKPATAEEKKEKIRFSIRNSIRYISKSKYLICVALIVLGYNIAINLTDILWKGQLKSFFTNPNEMLMHMNQITMGTGIFATIGGVLFSVMVNRLGWTFPAILTPVIMTVMAIGFFTFLFCGDLLTALSLSLLGTTPLALTVYFGSMQNCLSKAGKYSVFDATKELAFLPLDADSRLKGKAAIDGLGSGLGKSGASLTYQGFIILFGSVAMSTPYIAVILFSVFAAWIYSVLKVGKEFKKMTGAEPVTTLPELAESKA